MWINADSFSLSKALKIVWLLFYFFFTFQLFLYMGIARVVREMMRTKLKLVLLFNAWNFNSVSQFELRYRRKQDAEFPFEFESKIVEWKFTQLCLTKKDNSKKPLKFKMPL